MEASYTASLFEVAAMAAAVMEQTGEAGAVLAAQTQEFVDQGVSLPSLENRTQAHI